MALHGKEGGLREQTQSASTSVHGEKQNDHANPQKILKQKQTSRRQIRRRRPC